MKRQLTNQKFGKLTVIKETEQRKHGCIVWECQCECGNICYVPTTYLTSGDKQSCGCLQKKRIHYFDKDISNQKFGLLTAMYPTDKKTLQGSKIWHCKCDCGNEKDVSRESLIQGNTKSCGCLIYNKPRNKPRIDLTGQHFGKWTVVEPEKETPKGHHKKWLCECECGTMRYVDGNTLRNGKSLSCGCQRFSKGEAAIQKILDENNILYNKEYVLPDLVKETNKRLRFDFVIFDKDGNINRFIEFDGKQHFTGMEAGVWSHMETLDVIRARDQIKNDYCIKNNYILIRIPYTKLNTLKLEDIMSDKFKITEIK